MPSPIGHALAGLAVAWAADLVPGDRAWRTAPASASWYRRAGNGLTLACVALGAAPDLDLLFVTPPHGDAQRRRRRPGRRCSRRRWPRTRIGRSLRVASMCAAAYATHLLLDWLGVDLSPPRGIQALWPFSDRVVHLGLGSSFGRRNAASLCSVADACVTNVAAIAAGDRDARTDRRRAVASTCKSPGRTSVRAGPPRPSGAVADTAGTSDRRGRRAARSGSRGRRRGR